MDTAFDSSIASDDVQSEIRSLELDTLLEQYGDALGCSPEVRSRALEIIHIFAEYERLSSKSPSAIAAAAIYVAANEYGASLSENEVSDTTHVTTTSIQQRANECLAALREDNH